MAETEPSCLHRDKRLIQYVERPHGIVDAVWECWTCEHRWVEHDEP
jgi:hypothetical protein